MFINTAYASIDTVVFAINKHIINPAIVILFIFALVVFIWGIVQYILNGTDSKERSTGKQHMFWGIVGFSIMVSVFFIMRFVLKTIGVPENEVNISNEGESTVDLQTVE